MRRSDVRSGFYRGEPQNFFKTKINSTDTGREGRDTGGIPGSCSEKRAHRVCRIEVTE